MGSVDGHEGPGGLSSTVADVVFDAVRAYASECERQGHALCKGTESCRAAATVLEEHRKHDSEARAFDVGLIAAEHLGSEPTIAWPSTALLRLVRDQLERPPWGSDGFRRSVLITSALARLGERGIPADAIVRLCMGPYLRRRITFQVVAAQQAVVRGDATVAKLPWQLQAWLEVLSGTTDLGDPESVTMAALAGPLAQTIDAWLQEGALSHLIAWRRDAERVEIDPEDLVLPGGAEATRWVFDRFTRTALDDWSLASLTWELAFVQRSAEVCKRAGLPVALLGERSVSQEMVINAIARRVAVPAASDPIIAGMTANEVIENLVVLVKLGSLDAALSLAQSAVVAAPRAVEMKVAAAFLLIPDAPAQAEKDLRRLLTRPGVPVGLVRVNLVSALARLGELDAAARGMAELDGLEGGLATDAWLWRPASLLGGERLSLAEYTLADWRDEMRELLRSSAQVSP